MSAYEKEILSDSRVANEDLSSSQFLAVSPTSDDNVDLSDLAGESIAGVMGLLRNAPVSGSEASVGMVGIYIGKLGGTVTRFDTVTCDANGKIVRARPGDWILGVALESGVLNDQKPIFCAPQYPADIYFTAQDDLTGLEGYALSVHSTAGEADLADNGESAIGIALTGPAAAAAVKVRTFGVCQAVAGTGGVTVGNLLGCEAGGKLVVAATGDHVVGVALATIAADATGTIFFQPRGTVA